MVVPNDVRKVRLKLAEYMRAQGSVARASLLKSRDRRLPHQRSADAIEAWARYHGYPNTVARDEEAGTVDVTVGLATPEPPPNETLMVELATLRLCYRWRRRTLRHQARKASSPRWYSEYPV
jgi:hypothetical protein